MLNDSWSDSISARRASAEAGNFFFQPVELHIEPTDLLEQFGLTRLLSRCFLNAVAGLEQPHCPKQQLLLPNLYLRRMHVEQSRQLLNRLLLLNSRQCHLRFELG